MAPGDGADIGVELLRDVLEHEHHQEEIERIERPAEKARRHDMLLLAGPAGKRRDCHLSLSDCCCGSIDRTGVRSNRRPGRSQKRCYRIIRVVNTLLS